MPQNVILNAIENFLHLKITESFEQLERELIDFEKQVDAELKTATSVREAAWAAPRGQVIKTEEEQQIPQPVLSEAPSRLVDVEDLHRESKTSKEKKSDPKSCYESIKVRWRKVAHGFLSEALKTQMEKMFQNYEEWQKQIKVVKELFGEQRGRCHGFSICHGAMAHLGKLSWWEQALVKIATWDGTREALKKEVEFSEAAEEKEVPEAQNGSQKIFGKTMGDIFERMLDYVLTCYAFQPEEKAACAEFFLEGVTQNNILDPQAYCVPESKPEVRRSYFELVDGQGKIKTVQKQEKMSGHFTQAQLSSFLEDGHKIKNKICLMSSINARHTVRIGVEGLQWIIYDPNYDHRSLKTIHKVGTKEEIIKEALRILGPSLTVELASLDEEKEDAFPLYHQRIKTLSVELLQKNGGYELCCRSPAVLGELLEAAEKEQNSKKREAFRRAVVKGLLKLQKGTQDAWHNGLLVLAIPERGNIEVFNRAVRILAESFIFDATEYFVFEATVRKEILEPEGVYSKYHKVFGDLIALKDSGLLENREFKNFISKKKDDVLAIIHRQESEANLHQALKTAFEKYQDEERQAAQKAHEEYKRERDAEKTKPHWRLSVAIVLGIALLVLAFTPAGPALAALLTLKAAFTPVFAWLGQLSLGESIGLGIGLGLSGFILGGLSWFLGMGLKIILGAGAVAFSQIKKLLSAAKNAIEKFTQNKVVRGLAYVVGTLVYAVLTLIQLSFLVVAMIGDFIFRRLGAPLVRVFYNPPVSSQIKVVTSSVATDQEYHPSKETVRASLVDCVQQTSFDEGIAIYSFNLVNDALSLEKNPHDAAADLPRAAL